jgi:hypothetical protein
VKKDALSRLVQRDALSRLVKREALSPLVKRDFSPLGKKLNIYGTQNECKLSLARQCPRPPPAADVPASILAKKSDTVSVKR